ncbi:MAG TPA: diaminopropionate ammonia-lyase [Roseiflexaceae bacterium]|nr:diaminopropionate ammonia-lyase [Roseiflexaceae bacterium]HMP41171.1 diaminopropionate ammonia-lyase [Roseiflexaceae bacterium]
MRFYHNPVVHRTPAPLPDRAALAFHRRLPGYQATPLRQAPALAQHLGIGEIWIKEETCRMGLPAFKILGAAWAIRCALEAHLGGLAAWETIDDLRLQVQPHHLRLAAATDGNHGRAVAHMARRLGCAATILVPAGTAAARIDALLGEGATVIVVDGTYDDAVARSATLATADCLVISDTSWPGYERIPHQVIEGYSTIFHEVDDALPAAPDLVMVQMGVGALAAAVIRHYRRPGGPRIVGVEPERAACVLESLKAGTLVDIPGPHDSIMAGLNCGAPSLIAWPLLQHGLDAATTVSDEQAREAMRLLAAAGIIAGETGAAGLAGLLALDTEERTILGLGPHSRVLAIVTEGATDPIAYEQIVGRHAATCAEQQRCPLCRMPAID